MTRLLDGISLRTYFLHLDLQSEAQELLRQVRSLPPTRMSGIPVGNMPVWYPRKKMQCSIKAESARVEFAFLLEAERSDKVIEFWDQSPSIPLEYHGKPDHLRWPVHTTDCFVC